MPRAESQDDFLTDLTRYFKKVKNEDKGTVQITLKRYQERVLGPKPPASGGKAQGGKGVKRPYTLAEPACLLRVRCGGSRSSCKVQSADKKFREQFGVILRAHADGLLAKGETPKPKPKKQKIEEQALSPEEEEKRQKKKEERRQKKKLRKQLKAAKKTEQKSFPKKTVPEGKLPPTFKKGGKASARKGGSKSGGKSKSKTSSKGTKE
eukprot:gb/GEZN01015052.1/.p1 GENE.gb/GEZN01015052.1/~~gb/GEZN01015052.1/.p1  ORF type:complete len:232 (+),score=50.82 gb/GEZN01015052.1/:73-696(+)